MKCSNCGTEFNGTFCTNCGASAKTESYTDGQVNQPVGNTQRVVPAQPISPQTSKNMKKCKSCGAQIAKSAKSCPSCGAKNKKPLYKRWWFWVAIVILIIFIVSLCSPDESDSSNTDPKVAGSDVLEGDNNNLGLYSVKITDGKLKKGYDGKQIAIISVEFTNNASEAVAFNIAFEHHAYQNGIEAEHCYYTGDDGFDENNGQSKQIKPGATITVQIAYHLNDTSTPLEVEIGRWLSFDSTKVTKTFDF